MAALARCLIDGTGMRISEALALEWDDVDLGHRMVNVRRRVYKGLVGPTKTTSSRRTVPIARDVARLLFVARSNAAGRLLGHSDVTVTMRVYVHELPGAALPDIDALLAGEHKRGTPAPDTAEYNPPPATVDLAPSLKVG